VALAPAAEGADLAVADINYRSEVVGELAAKGVILHGNLFAKCRPTSVET
jgi:hypothetical protein